jgi:hypothetical protein
MLAGTDTTYGASCAHAGDFNGDGLSDLAYTGPPALIGVYYGDAGAAGPLHMVRDRSGTVPDRPWSHFAGDVNGDGYSDVVEGEDPIRNAIVYGSPSGMLTSAPIASPVGVSGYWGHATNGVGDVNGDGFWDVAIGCGDSATAVDPVGLYLGASTGLGTAILATPPAGAMGFGAAVARAPVLRRTLRLPSS